MSTRELFCVELPQWLSVVATTSEPVRETAQSTKEVSESSGGSLLGLCTTFMLGWQVSSYGLAEGFTRLSESVKGKGKSWEDLAVILWAVGVFFGKLGFGRPALEKQKERERIEKATHAQAKIRANIDRPIEDQDVGRYVRYKHGEHRSIGLMVGFNNLQKVVTVKHMLTDERLVVDMRTVSFVSDEEKKRS